MPRIPGEMDGAETSGSFIPPPGRARGKRSQPQAPFSAWGCIPFLPCCLPRLVSVCSLRKYPGWGCRLMRELSAYRIRCAPSSSLLNRHGADLLLISVLCGDRDGTSLRVPIRIVKGCLDAAAVLEAVIIGAGGGNNSGGHRPLADRWGG